MICSSVNLDFRIGLLLRRPSGSLPGKPEKYSIMQVTLDQKTGGRAPLFGARPENVFVLKMNYWLSL